MSARPFEPPEQIRGRIAMPGRKERKRFAVAVFSVVGEGRRHNVPLQTQSRSPSSEAEIKGTKG